MKDLILKAIKAREPLKKITNAIRLINGKGDQLEGLVLEQYNQHYIAHVSNAQWIEPSFKKLLSDIVKTNLGGQYLIVKDRTLCTVMAPDKIRTEIWIENTESSTVVKENNLQFSIELNDTVNSGLFLDMRKNRQIISEMAQGLRVLNCFAYTCSFGLYCRKAGAAGVVNVDLSNKILKRAITNYELNEIEPSKNEFIVEDALAYLHKAVRKENTFDMIILDPPSFSRNGDRSFSVSHDFKELIELSIKILNPNGLLFASTNFSKISNYEIERMIRSSMGMRHIKMHQHLGQDVDFPGSGLRPDSHLAAVLVRIE